jgi:tetratricopeptide (TPR) repeat protein
MMVRSALALCGAGLLLLGCQAQAKVQSPSPSAGIPELISRCVDGREIAGQAATCTMAVQAKVGSDDLQDLARYSLALAERPSPAPRAIPEPIIRCLYTFDVERRLVTCTRAIDSKAGSTEMQALAHHARAIAHCRDGHPERSVVDESEAIALVPNFPAAYAHRAECKQALRDLDGARDDQAEAIRLAPDVPGYYRQAAMIANLAGDHDAALQRLDYAIRRWPRFNEVVDLRAKTLFNLGRYDEAAEAFVQTVRMFPGDERAVLWLHLARMRAGQPDAAEFAANTASLRLSDWTKPIFDYYQGRGDFTAAFQVSLSSDDSDVQCATTLFIGEHMLAMKEPLAITYLRTAASDCDSTTAPTSRMAAWAEVKKLSPEFRGEGWSR